MKMIFLFLVLACGLKADTEITINGTAQQGEFNACTGSFNSTDSVTYALNGATKTVSSAVIDTANWSGFSLTFSSSGSGIVGVWSSNTPTAGGLGVITNTFKRDGLWTGDGTTCIHPAGRYVKIQNLSSLTYTTVSAFYLPTYQNSQSITVNGVVTLSNSDFGLTRVAGTAATSYYDKLTTPASYSAVSNPVSTLMTAAYSMNITAAVGVSGACQFCFSSVGPSNGFYYDWSSSATPPATFSSFYPVSAKAVCMNEIPAGSHLHLSVTAAALTMTVKPKFAVKVLQ